MRRIRIHSFSFLFLLTAAFLASACSRRSLRSEPTEPSAQLHDQQASADPLLVEVSARLQALETQFNSMNDKIDLTRQSIQQLTAEVHTQSSGVVDKLSFTSSPLASTLSDQDPELGFVFDAATQSFRNGMILYQGAKYQDAILVFTSFLEKFPSHPLAGNAQFHIAESYAALKESKQALEEYKRVLSSYDQSEFISYALAELVLLETQMGLDRDAEKHRQLLSSIFPQSPAWMKINNFKNDSTRSLALEEKIDSRTPSSISQSQSVRLDPPPTIESESFVENP